MQLPSLLQIVFITFLKRENALIRPDITLFSSIGLTFGFILIVFVVSRRKPAGVYTVLATDWQNHPAGCSSDKGRKSRCCSTRCRHSKTAQTVRSISLYLSLINWNNGCMELLVTQNTMVIYWVKYHIAEYIRLLVLLTRRLWHFALNNFLK